jgi:hypothetical protein
VPGICDHGTGNVINSKKTGISELFGIAEIVSTSRRDEAICTRGSLRCFRQHFFGPDSSFKASALSGALVPGPRVIAVALIVPGEGAIHPVECGPRHKYKSAFFAAASVIL